MKRSGKFRWVDGLIVLNMYVAGWGLSHGLRPVGKVKVTPIDGFSNGGLTIFLEYRSLCCPVMKRVRLGGKAEDNYFGPRATT